MLLETESGIMARADAHVARIMMDGNRTVRRLLAAERTIARAYQRVLVLRQFAAHRELVHKIGITGGSVEARIAGAADDATYLLAGVDVVATYKLYEVNRPRLEALIHRVLDRVRFEVELPDRFGKLVRPREWFFVPLSVIDEVVQRIGDGSLAGMTYDHGAAALTHA